MFGLVPERGTSDVRDSSSIARKPAALIARADAWPTKFVAGEWGNASDENVIEQVTLAYDFFELVP